MNTISYVNFASEPNTAEKEESYYKALCDELVLLMRNEKELKKRREQLRDEVIELSGGNRMEYGIEVKSVEKPGSIDYKALCEDYCITEETLEKYRKEPTIYTNVRSY